MHGRNPFVPSDLRMTVLNCEGLIELRALQHHLKERLQRSVPVSEPPVEHRGRAITARSAEKEPHCRDEGEHDKDHEA